MSSHFSCLESSSHLLETGTASIFSGVFDASLFEYQFSSRGWYVCRTEPLWLTCTFIPDLQWLNCLGISMQREEVRWLQYIFHSSFHDVRFHEVFQELSGCKSSMILLLLQDLKVYLMVNIICIRRRASRQKDSKDVSVTSRLFFSHYLLMILFRTKFNKYTT